MMNISKLVPLYEQVLLLEISEGFLKKQVERLSKQNVYVEPDTIKQMILRFEQLKNSANTKLEIKRMIETGIDNKDIKAVNPQDNKRIENLKKSPWSLEFYNFAELEKIVHSFRGVEDKEAKKAAETKIKDTDYGAELVYESPDKTLQVFHAKDAKTAVAFKTWLVNYFAEDIKKLGLTVDWGIGRNLYGWCVAASLNRGNMFNNYRFGQGGLSEYFVLDKKLKVNNPEHLLVIHAYKDGRYLVTNAVNSEDKFLKWPEIVSRKPELKGTEDIFKFQPYTEDEQLWSVTRSAKPADFAGFTPRVKRAYIELGPQNKMFKNDWIALGTIDPTLTHAERANLTKINSDLQHTYINVRVPAPGNQASPLENAYVLLDLFADSKGKDIERRITKAFELGDVSVESSPLYMDETILNHTLDKGVIKYWKKLVDDCLTDQGAAVRARKAN